MGQLALSASLPRLGLLQRPCLHSINYVPQRGLRCAFDIQPRSDIRLPLQSLHTPSTSVPSQTASSASSATADDDSPALGDETLSSPRIRKWLIARFLLAFNGICFEKVLILFCFTPLVLGGLGRAVRLRSVLQSGLWLTLGSPQPSEIGIALAFSGFLGIIGSLFVFPPLHRHCGTLSTYILFMSFWPAVFFAMPFLSVVVRNLRPEAPSTDGIVWTGLGFTLLLGRIANLSWT